MSLGIAFKGPEGIVLAADSRVTLTAALPGPVPGSQHLLPSTFDNATKLLSVKGQEYVGAITYGLGAIGQNEPRTAHSFIPEFETDLSNSSTPRLPVEQFAQSLADFFMARWQKLMPASYSGPDMIFLVGGYNDAEAYGRVYEVVIPSRPSPVEQTAGEFGITWGGQAEFVARLLHGYDVNLLNLAKQSLSLDDQQVYHLKKALQDNLGARIPYQFLPLQDCIDLSIFLIRATAAIQNWTVGIRGVGGAIDVATITRTDGFRPVQQKSIRGE